MTLTYDKLEDFVRNLKQKYPNQTIPPSNLLLEIGKSFGLSQYVKTNIMKNLRKYNFIKLRQDGFWDIVWLDERERKIKKIEQDYQQEIEKEKQKPIDEVKEEVEELEKQIIK